MCVPFEGIGGGESGEDADDLEQWAAVVAGDFGVGIHRLKELEEEVFWKRKIRSLHKMNNIKEHK